MNSAIAVVVFVPTIHTLLQVSNQHENHIYHCLSRSSAAFLSACLAYCAGCCCTPHIPPLHQQGHQRLRRDQPFQPLTLSFGSLNKAGYCLSDGTCHQFAIAIGETGTAFTNALDTPSMADFANYLTNTGKAVQSASATGV